MLRKSIRFVDKAVDRIVAVLCLLLFLICLYAMLDAYHVYTTASDKGALKYKPETAKAAEVLRDLSEDAVAWLTLDGTNIDYPVMQGKNNDIYLNKDPFGEFSLSGSIFLDSRNNGDFEDDYSLIYGHHMEYGVMFGALDSYIQKDYFDRHTTGTLITVTGKSYRIRVFAACKAQATEKLIFDPNESDNQSLLGYLKQNAAIYKPDDINKDSKLIALSTCQSAESIERMIVVGELSETI